MWWSTSDPMAWSCPPTPRWPPSGPPWCAPRSSSTWTRQVRWWVSPRAYPTACRQHSGKAKTSGQNQNQTINKSKIYPNTAKLTRLQSLGLTLCPRLFKIQTLGKFRSFIFKPINVWVFNASGMLRSGVTGMPSCRLFRKIASTDWHWCCELSRCRLQYLKGK